MSQTAPTTLAKVIGVVELVEAVNTVRDHERQWRDHAGHPKPPWGELANSKPPLLYPGCYCGDVLADDGPGASSHTHMASSAMDYGGVIVSAVLGKQWWFKWGAQGVEGIKAKTRCHRIGWRWMVRG